MTPTPETATDAGRATQDEIEALERWIGRELLATQRVMKLSVTRGDGQANFAAHEAHKQFSVAARLLARLKAKEAEIAEAERDLIRWRSAFQSVTPGGSEFFDPKAVREWADKLKTATFEANKRAVLSERRAVAAERELSEAKARIGEAVAAERAACWQIAMDAARDCGTHYGGGYPQKTCVEIATSIFARGGEDASR